ncbi:MAG: protein-glutamate O-methyltransferase CheR [Gemmatimonadota bacterium]|nr:protein-glutamate O-methyltransferase CheR [Gemmatimonadota bacterium]
MYDDHLGDDGFQELTEKITRETPFRCTSYKDRCVRRRIAVRMRARGAETFRDYADLLDADVAEYEQLLDALTVNVTKFFRNPAAFAALSRHAVPELWERGDDIRAWSAGSASGEEPFSIAALFYEFASSRNQVAELDRVRVLGSDIDRGSLDAASEAVYLPSSFTDTTEERIASLFPEVATGRTIRPEIRRMVSFERRDILRDISDAGPFDLIACRNVVIYLDRESQEKLLDGLVDVLRPGGYLMMGHVETLFGGARKRLTPVDMRERIYRKPSS